MVTVTSDKLNLIFFQEVTVTTPSSQERNKNVKSETIQSDLDLTNENKSFVGDGRNILESHL